MTLPHAADTDAVFRIGHVVAVQGREVRIEVSTTKNGSHLLYRGQMLRNIAVGGYLKICKGFTEIIAKVEGERITEAHTNPGYRSHKDRIRRELTVSLVGYLSGGQFRRGIRELPLVHNECFLLNEHEFDLIHSLADADDVALQIGTLAMEKGQPVRVGVNSLFASHIGIFGNTGSGKSYTLAKLYYECVQRFKDEPAFRKGARVVIVDFNGEYVDRDGTAEHEQSGSVIAPRELKRQYRLTTRDDDGERLPFPADTVADPGFWSVLLDATEKTQAPFLTRALRSPRWKELLDDPSRLGGMVGQVIHSAILKSESASDRGAIFKFLDEVGLCVGDPQGEYQAYVTDLKSKLKYHGKNRCYYVEDGMTTRYSSDDGAYFERITKDALVAITSLTTAAADEVDKVRLRIVLQYYWDIFNGFGNPEHLGPLIKRLENRSKEIKRVICVDDDADLIDRPVTVVGLKHVNLEMKKVIPLLLCRELYDRKKATNEPPFLNIVIDEAHNILSTHSVREAEAWKDYRLETFEEIIKEGRKFGVFLTIASQRPHDISETIISQLHNYFLHRLVNNLDVYAIEKAVSYLDKVSFDTLPILPTGTCILSGISAQLPLVVSIDQLPARFEPNNRTMTLVDKWLGDGTSPDADGSLSE